MKIQVNLKIASQIGATGKVEIAATEDDKVQTIKERVAACQLVAFPDYHIESNGVVLDDSSR
jgi:hypothetical protein